jgi:integrase
LRWDQIDLKGGVIYLWAGSTKNRAGRTAPIYGELAPELEMARAAIDQSFPDCPWVCNRNGKPLSAIYKDWRKACEAAAVPDLRPHDLRRTAVRNMLRAGIAEKVAMQIIGHKTAAMLWRYAIINERDLKEAGSKMDRWLQSETVTETVTVEAEKPN